MADPTLVEILKNGVGEWNARRYELSRQRTWESVRRWDLSAADLRSMDLSEADFKGVDLQRAQLGKARLEDADLRGALLNNADLSEAYLSGTRLESADLSYARLNDAMLGGANFTKASLLHANLTNAQLGGSMHETGEEQQPTVTFYAETIFVDSDLTGVIGLDTCDHVGPSYVDMYTVINSGALPMEFLEGCGLPSNLLGFLMGIHPKDFYSCFISYSHEDKAFARRLESALRARGVRCWLDEKQLLPGDDIYEHVDRGIRQWDKVLLCCSKNSLSSWWVDSEIGKAFTKEQMLMNEREKRVLALIPLNLDGYLFKWEDGKADEVRRRVAADFTGWEAETRKFTHEVDNLVMALRSDERARELPPEPKL